MDTSYEHIPETPPRTARFALATVLVAAIAAGIGIFVYLEMTKHEVTAYLQICRSPAGFGWPKNLVREESDEEFDRFRRTEAELLRSKLVLTRAVRDPSISGLSFLRYKSDPVIWLEENLKIDYPNKGELLRVRLSASDPIQAAQAVDAVIHAYFKEIVERRTKERIRAEVQLRESLQEKSESLLRDMRDAAQIALKLDAESVTNPELQVKQRRIAIEQETVDELVRQLEFLSLVNHMPARVQLLDDASDLADR